MKTILLTNDDGYLADGIQYLKRALSAVYNVYVVAPDRERSAVSMSLTITRPLRLTQKGPQDFIVDGTPSDCINIALQKVLPHYPDFVVSGMNEGENLGEDVFFSGTVAGAFAGHLYGIPSLAVSLVLSPQHIPLNYEASAHLTQQVLAYLMPLNNHQVVYNLNIPTPPSGNIKITKTGLKRYQPSIIERVDPRHRHYYWVGAGNPVVDGAAGTDLEAIAQGHSSLSVLEYDLNSPTETQKLTDVFLKHPHNPLNTNLSLTNEAKE